MNERKCGHQLGIVRLRVNQHIPDVMGPQTNSNFFARFRKTSEIHREQRHTEDPFLSIYKVERVFVPQDAPKPDGADGPPLFDYHELSKCQFSFPLHYEQLCVRLVIHNKIGQSKEAVRIPRASIEMLRLDTPKNFSVGIINLPVSFIAALEAIFSSFAWLALAVGLFFLSEA